MVVPSANVQSLLVPFVKSVVDDPPRPGLEGHAVMFVSGARWGR